jgi:DHA1 family bicyclomycin/chloramphenicol resistance-like MFS transporter
VPETARRLRPDATRPRVLLAALAAHRRHRVFVAWALLTSATYGGLFTMLAGVVLRLHRRAGPVAGRLRRWCWARLAGLHRRHLRLPALGAAHGPVGAVQRGAWFTLAGGLAMALPRPGVQSVWAIALPHGLFAVGHGVHQPCSQAGAVGPFPDQAGAASALAGFVLAAVAFGIGLWLGRRSTARCARWPMAWRSGRC